MSTHRTWSLAALFLALGLLALVGFRLRFFSGMPRPLSDLYLDVVPEHAVALAPDGGALAYVASYGDDTLLHVRTVGDGRVSRFPGTEGASVPFFSSDGRNLGFFSAGALRRLSLATGAIVELAQTDSVTAAIFREDGALLFGSARGLMMASAPGSAPEPLSTPPVRGLSPVPGSDWVLVEVEAEGGRSSIEALSLSSREVRALEASGSHPRYSPSGHLLFLREGALWARKMDPLRAELSGEGAVVLPDVSWFDVETNGTLAYLPRAGRRPAFRVVAHWVEELRRLAPDERKE